MPTSENPFTAPDPSFGSPGEVEWIEDTGLWRQGNLMVIRKGSDVFPPRCIKTNEPAETSLKRALSWHPPIIYVLVAMSPIIYIIVALIIRHQATIHIGLCEEMLEKRRRHILLAWLGALTGVATFITGVVLIEYDGLVYTLFVGMGVFFVSIIAGMVGSRMVTPTKIDKKFAWVKGAGEPFLETLPDWPHLD